MIDLGVAHSGRGDGVDREIVGTRSYMAPELLHGSTRPPADIYSLGLLGIGMFLGCPRIRLHASGPAAHEILTQHQRTSRLGRLLQRMVSPRPLARPGLDEIEFECDAIALSRAPTIA